jgi:hypothetical protein
VFAYGPKFLNLVYVSLNAGTHLVKWLIVNSKFGLVKLLTVRYQEALDRLVAEKPSRDFLEIQNSLLKMDARVEMIEQHPGDLIYICSGTTFLSQVRLSPPPPPPISFPFLSSTETYLQCTANTELVEYLLAPVNCQQFKLAWDAYNNCAQKVPCVVLRAHRKGALSDPAAAAIDLRAHAASPAGRILQGLLVSFKGHSSCMV